MKRRKDADFINSVCEKRSDVARYIRRFIDLSIASFHWNNLPESVDPRFLEMNLFLDSYMLFFRDEQIGELALRAMIGGNMNVYNIPTLREAFAPNGYRARRTEKDSVIIYNNMTHSNSAIDIFKYAEQLANIDKTIQINLNAHKTPILLICDENQRLTLQNLYLQYEGGYPVIKGNKGLSQNAIQVIDTGAPYLIDKLYDYKTQVWNEALTFLGISNLTINKKERVITDEVYRSQGGTLASRMSRLNARNFACEEINRMFDLNVSCEFKECPDDTSVPDYNDSEEAEPNE